MAKVHIKMLGITNHQRFKSNPQWDTTSQLAVISSSTNNRCWRGCGERGALPHCWWERRLVQPLWKAGRRHLRKLKMDLPLTQRFHFWEYIRRTRNSSSKDHKHPYVHCSAICHPQGTEAARPIGGGADENLRCTDAEEFHLGLKKKKTSPAVTARMGPGAPRWVK